MVPGAGLEPARGRAPRDFKSLASTSSAIQAWSIRYTPLGSLSMRSPTVIRQPYLGKIYSNTVWYAEIMGLEDFCKKKENCRYQGLLLTEGWIV
jgi:hypothetical protein